jgi:hypothetical protein
MVRKIFLSRGPLAGLTFCLAGLLAAPISGHKIDSARRMSMFHDWSMRYVVYPAYGPVTSMLAAQRDTRAIFNWERRMRWREPVRHPVPRFDPLVPIIKSRFDRDWSVNLGTAGTAIGMYPAKFSFDVTQTPSCANDFVVFPIAAQGSAAQPNIVAFNYLYSGTAGANGICNRTASGTDSGTAAEVYWSYAVEGIAGGGAVPTSPVLSFDPVYGSDPGTKVAFVESEAGSPAHFHVLAWKGGDGQSASDLQSVGLGEIVSASVTSGQGGTKYAVGNTGTISGGTGATYQVTAVSGGAVTAFTITAAGTGYSVANGASTTATSGNGKGFEVNITSVRSPKIINSFSSTAPASGSGTATDLTLGSSTSGTDTLSSPFVDYGHDVAYVGNDIGQLYRIKDVFCTQLNPDCTGSTQPAPSIDTSWGTGGVVTVCTGELTAPVLDFVSGNVFVGCSDGKLYAISQTATVTSLAVGDGTASKTYGGIVDPPIVDGVNGFVYVVSGSANNGANGVLVQATTNLSSSVAVPVGAGNQCDMHAPALSNAYYTSPTSAGSLIYVAGVTGTVGPCTATGATGGDIVIYGATFGAGGVLSSGAPADSAVVGNPGNEFAPLEEFFNAQAGEDFLFFAVLCTGADIDSFNITPGWSSTFLVTPVTEGLGTSGMVVDNDASSTTYPQASSIYFNALNENAACGNPQTGTNSGGCAVKLTQSGLE